MAIGFSVLAYRLQGLRSGDLAALIASLQANGELALNQGRPCERVFQGFLKGCSVVVRFCSRAFRAALILFTRFVHKVWRLTLTLPCVPLPSMKVLTLNLMRWINCREIDPREADMKLQTGIAYHKRLANRTFVKLIVKAGQI